MAYVSVKNDDKLKKLFAEIFTDNFMQRYTNFETFSHFQYAGAVIANWQAAKIIYNEELLDLFVKESTQFTSFDQMVKTATNECYKNNKGE